MNNFLTILILYSLSKNSRATVTEPWMQRQDSLFSCGRHALNNAVQHDCFRTEQLDNIATTFDKDYFTSDGYSNLVLLSALNKTGYITTEANQVVIEDFEKEKVCSLLCWQPDHWFTIIIQNGAIWLLDSLLDSSQKYHEKPQKIIWYWGISKKPTSSFLQ